MSTKTIQESVSKYPLHFGGKPLNSVDLYFTSTMSVPGDFCPCRMECSLGPQLLEWPPLIGHIGTTEIPIPPQKKL